MSENNMKYSDLCSTCKNAPDCTFPKYPQKPVLNCEEFEIEVCDGGQTPVKAVPSAAASAYPDEEDPGKFTGLCSNCEDRETCGFPRPEGGVWHCEEYR